MFNNMFHSAALKLTLSYLAIIMSLSISMSAIIYHLSANQLWDSARSQANFFNDLRRGDTDRLQQISSDQVDSALRNLRANLAVFNLMVLVAGGAISYALARRSLEPIEAALETQKRFTGDASHELRSPLTVIQAETEVTLRNPNLSKKAAVDQLKSNLEEVAKLKALSDGLLRLSSAEGVLQFDKAVSLKAAAQQAIDRWHKIAAAKQIEIVKDLSPVKVKGDQDSLAELISILLDNAVKYSPAGSQVTVKTAQKDKSASLSVTDQGDGIAKKDLPYIFDRLFRADTGRSKDNQNGYGLGLAIAKQIADAHSARLEVSSQVGKGSVFTLHLQRV